MIIQVTLRFLISKLTRIILAIAFGVSGLAWAGATTVAIPPVLLLKSVGSGYSSRSAAPLADRVQFTLEADPSFANNTFVERASLESLLKEQTLALVAPTELSPTASIRTGRLLHADWILCIRLRADDLTRPRVEAEVIDALRADLLSHVETPLEELPNESWLLQPNDKTVLLSANLASRALRSAEARRTELAASTRIAPLSFIDRSGNERLAPLGPLLQAALRQPRPGLHVLGYEADSPANAESALFLTGLTDLEPASWGRIADAYVWGEFTETASYSGPVADLPVNVRLTVWSDDRGPREISLEGRLGDLPSLAARAASAALALVGESRISDPFTQRPAVAARLRESALELRRQASTATLPRIAAPIIRAANRLDQLADFFNPQSVSLQSDTPKHTTTASTLPMASAAPATPQGATLDPSSNQSLGALLTAADASPIMQSPWLAPEWTALNLAARSPQTGPGYEENNLQPYPLALAHDALWVIPRPAWRNLSENNQPGLWKLVLSSPDARAVEMADMPGLLITEYAPSPDNRIWFATRGEGLVGVDPTAASPMRRIGVADGLPRSDLMHVHRGPKSWFIGTGRESEGTVTSVSFDALHISQLSAPPESMLCGLPAAARAAIAAYGDTQPPLVRLPAHPFFAYEQKPALPPDMPLEPFAKRWAESRLRPVRNGPEERDPRQLGAIMPTGAGDGYWTTNLHTVFWAAGTRLVPLACWLQGEICMIADDGRHVIIAVARRDSIDRIRTIGSGDAPEPDKVALHLYDYRDGVWRGKIASSGFFSFIAGDGRLLLIPPTRSAWQLTCTSSLKPTSAPPEPRSRPLPEIRRSRLSKNNTAPSLISVQDSLIKSIDAPAADLDALRAALAAGANSAPTANDQTPPILLAAKRRHFEAFEILLPLVSSSYLNATPSPRPNSKTRPLRLELLHELLEARRPDLVHRVLAAGLNPDYAPPDEKNTLTWLAIRCGDPLLVVRFHAAGWQLSMDGLQTPLGEAVTQKNAELLRQLLALSSREEINDMNRMGQTALFAAADAGWTDGVRLLLEAGADNFNPDLISKRQLRDAAAKWPEVALLLNRRPGAPDNHIDGARAIAAIVKGDEAFIRTITATPSVFHYRDQWSWTVLHYAAFNRRNELVTRLLAAGAQPNDLTSYGESALCLAAAKGDTAIVTALLNAGADVNRHENRGWLPLHVAAKSGRADLVRTLLSAGADPTPSVGQNSTPVVNLAAATSNDEESLALLIKAGAPLDVVDYDGFGPLEAAVTSDSPAKIQSLLDHGAHWKKQLNDDYHPMDVAARLGLTRSIRKLQQLGLQSPRALSIARDDATRVLLQSDESEAGRLRRLNEEQWRVVIAEPDATRRHERVLAHIAAGADPNHLSAEWGTPLDLAVSCRDPGLVKLLVSKGADPAKKSKGYSAGPMGTQYLPVTALHGWFCSYFSVYAKPKSLPPDFEDLVLAYLPTFWPHDTVDARDEMLDWANRAKLTRAAAWMRAHN